MNAAKNTKAATAPTIAVPAELELSLERAVNAIARRTGESPEAVRRGVEVAILQRGIRSVLAEEGVR